jgi:DHA1 family bicyclomycin/chloramphenicol resistance-like MFS transporter
VGVLGNGEIALALVMTVGMVIALLALLAVGVLAAETEDDVTGDAVAEAA